MDLQPHKFSQLLVALLLMVALNPLLDELGFIRTEILLNVFFAVIWLSALYAVLERKRRFYFVAALAGGGAFFRWFNEFHPTMEANLLQQVFLGSFFLSMAIFILQKVLNNEKVTWDKICAALCVYLLVGFFWACLYSFISAIHPMSFNNIQRGFRDLLYYSLITLATVGFGDITPVGLLARYLSALEAITGQFYLAVMIARLVGLQILHAKTPEANP